MGPGVEGRDPDAASEPRDGSIVPAFSDLAAAQREYYERTRTFPIAHIIVRKAALAEPGLVGELCDLFERAKAIVLGPTLENPAERPIPNLDLATTRQLFADDPWPYGIEASRSVLTTFLDNCLAQGLLDRSMTPEALFPEELPARYR
jgi:4,5-dihydroxyphthalate decarboxylase